MTDSHCHIFFSSFEEDRLDVLARARDAGVTRMIQVNCEEAEQEPLLQALEGGTFPVELRGTIGLHPTNFVEGYEVSEREQQRIWEFFERMYAMYARHVVAIGEIGFDFFHAHSREAQECFFRLQLEFAKKHGLPVVLHIRDAFMDAFRVLAEYAQHPMIFHCFTGTAEEVRYIQEHFPQGYVSFSGIVTYPKSDALREAALLVPRDRLLVETDCPFLSPQVERGKRNEPAFVTHTARALGELLGMSYEEIERITDQNCDRVFAW